MPHRHLLSIFALSALLAACSYFGGGDGMPKTDSLRTELPPANLPTYGTGDRYTYDNPQETWTVVDITNDLVHWKSSLGNSQVTVFDPLMPSVEWTLADKTRATRKILEWNGRMFPLKAGNKLTFKVEFRLGEDTASTHYLWKCSAGEPRQRRVPAGLFGTYPVFCERDDGYRAQGYYAPAVNKAVSITYMEPDGQTTVRSMQGFQLGSGQRIAARPGTSLPRGWSEAAVEWSMPYATDLVKRVPRPSPTIAATTAAAGTDSEPQTTAAPPSAPPPPKTATVSGGRYLVQLSSLSAPVSARKEWARLQNDFPDLLWDRKLLLEKGAIAGRGTFYRVQTGRYEALREARAVCDTLKAKKQDCLVIKRAAAGTESEPKTTAVTPSAPSTPKTALVSDGRYLVQLSSLPAPTSARKEWARLQKAFPDLLGERELVLEERVIAGRGTFYRVQTGRYGALKEARAVCDTLKAKKQGCLVIER